MGFGYELIVFHFLTVQTSTRYCFWKTLTFFFLTTRIVIYPVCVHQQISLTLFGASVCLVKAFFFGSIFFCLYFGSPVVSFEK